MGRLMHHDFWLMVMAGWPLVLLTFLAFGSAAIAPWLNKR